jgi:hypothetical protein
MAMTLSKGSAIQIESGGTFYNLTEHNRSPIEATPIRIEKVKRTANGTARKFFIKEKKKISVSWDMVPSTTLHTVDGGWGGLDMKTFYESSAGQGTFRIKLNYAEYGTSNVQDPITVMFTECTFNLVKRGVQAFWNVSMVLEQV